MSVARVRKQKGGPPFVQILRSTLQDSRLTFRARGVHGWVMSKPDDWHVTLVDLCNNSPEGRTAVQSALDELVYFAYAVQVPIRDAVTRRLLAYDYLVCEKPLTENLRAAYARPVYLRAGEPTPAHLPAAARFADRLQAESPRAIKRRAAPQRAVNRHGHNRGETPHRVVEGEGAGDALRVVGGGHVQDDARTLLALRAELLGPAVGPLESYLAKRVPGDRQHAYVQVITGLFAKEAFWNRGDGTPLPAGERAAFLAEMLVGLESTDEQEGYGRPAGDPDNLKSRTMFNLNLLNKPQRGAAAAGGSPAAPGVPKGPTAQEGAAENARIRNARARDAEDLARWEAEHPAAAAALYAEIRDGFSRTGGKDLSKLTWEDRDTTGGDDSAGRAVVRPVYRARALELAREEVRRTA